MEQKRGVHPHGPKYMGEIVHSNGIRNSLQFSQDLNYNVTTVGSSCHLRALPTSLEERKNKIHRITQLRSKSGVKSIALPRPVGVPFRKVIFYLTTGDFG